LAWLERSVGEIKLALPETASLSSLRYLPCCRLKVRCGNLWRPFAWMSGKMTNGARLLFILR
jgi:hypothetical protein